MKALYGALAGRGADARDPTAADPGVKKVKAGRSDRIALRVAAMEDGDVDELVRGERVSGASERRFREGLRSLGADVSLNEVEEPSADANAASATAAHGATLRTELRTYASL